MIRGCVWRVVWGNPYTDPPAGKERLLAEVFEPVGSPFWSKHPPEITDAYPGVGQGYVISWSYVSDPPKQLNREQLANVRRKRLERRMRQKYPLLADQIIAEELSRKPDYYNGITDPKFQMARDEIIKELEHNHERRNT
ncbi:MAG: hypothetical protein ACYDGL_00820 [Bellilinea sp.]